MNQRESVIHINGRPLPISDLQIKFDPARPAYDQFTVLVTVDVDGTVQDVELDANGKPICGAIL